MKLFKKAKKGFTLVELVVVIAVIAILSAVSVGAYFGITESAKTSQCNQEAKAFHTALVVIANDPKYDESDSKYINISAEGLEFAGDFEADFHAYTGIEYTFVEAAPTKAPIEPTVYLVNNSDTFTYYNVGKVATVTVSTGNVVVADFE